MEPIVPTSHHALPISSVIPPSNTRIGNSCSAIPHGLGSITPSSILFLRKDDHWHTLFNDHWYSNDCIQRYYRLGAEISGQPRSHCSISPCVLYQKALAFVVFCFSSSFLCPSFFFNSDRASSKSTVGTAKKARFLSSINSSQ